MGFIEDYYFEGGFSQHPEAEHSAQYQEAMATLIKAEEILTAELTGAQKENFLEYVNAYSEILGISSMEGFVNGFRAGSKFTLDAFQNGKE